MLPGFVGIMLAIEALKIITGDVSSLSGYLLTFEAKKC
jgi:molybdopterin/thiamine biosynthesis adenylyltransferase